MKTISLYVSLILTALALSFQACSDDKVEGAVFSLSRDGQEVTDFTFGYSEMYQLVTLSSNTGWSFDAQFEHGLVVEQQPALVPVV